MRGGAVVLLALVSGAAAFTTTLHGGADEATPVGTPGAATLLLQPWLTQYDPEVRHSWGVTRACASRRGLAGRTCRFWGAAGLTAGASELRTVGSHLGRSAKASGTLAKLLLPGVRVCIWIETGAHGNSWESQFWFAILGTRWLSSRKSAEWP